MIKISGENSYHLTRRRFLEFMGKGFAAGSILTSLSSCNKSSNEIKLPFNGRVVGEKPFLCHRFRDGDIRIYRGDLEPAVKDVVIIGGGVSGLAAARRLAQANQHNILVLEKEDKLGGQSSSGELDGIRYARAAHFVESPHPRAAYIVDLYRELGIITGFDDNGWPVIADQHKLKQPYFGLFAENKWMPYSFPFQVADKKDIENFQTFYRDMYSWADWRDEDGNPAFCFPVSMTSPADDVRELDNITMADYLRKKRLKSTVLAWYVDNRLLNEYGTDATQTSAWAGIHYWAASKGGFEDIDPAGASRKSVLTWPEGNQFLINGLGRNLKPEHVALDSLVVRVQNFKNLVEITYIDTKAMRFKTVRGRYVIYASPKQMVYKVMPELSAENRDEFRLCEYVPWITSTMYLNRLPTAGQKPPAWDNMPYGRGWSLGYISEAHVSRRPSSYKGPTVLTFYGALHSNMRLERRELLEGGWDYWAKIILAEVEHMHPGITHDIEQMDIYKWAHAMAVPKPGLIWGSKRKQMEKPLGRIHFAHSDIGGLSVFEEAAYHGIRAAQEVLVRLDIPTENALSKGDWNDK